ncbi:MAG: alpha-hydroxy-acid oxidizing protein [Cytophagales bacterium]|nr:MAG: alpha-hydroxy-acid oxidizing protein [Cytophagales bacterium]
MQNNPQQSIGMQHQMQIYLQGLQQKKTSIPIRYEDLEAKAKEILKPEAFDYIAGGAGAERTMASNINDFDHWKILPQMLKNVESRDLSVKILGKKFPTPLFFAPVGVLSIAHPEAEAAVARAAKSLQIPQILSTVSSKSLEEIGEIHGENPHWFQLYWGRDHEFTKSLVQRAEKAGYSALVITLDTRLLAWRERDIQNAYLPFLLGEGLTNYFNDPVFRKAVPEPEKNTFQAIMHFAQLFSNPTLTWNDLKKVRRYCKIPILLKGILHYEDAQKAIDAGVDGIIVSNHGGRQIDGSISAIDALADIMTEIDDDKIEVLFDSGIRRGADVFKAIALGAKAVLVGRPYAYGLAVNGEQGVKEVMQNLLADTDLTMGLAGCKNWKEVRQDNVLFDDRPL